MASYQEKKSRLAEELAQYQGVPPRLGKSTSNLFRDRQPRPDRVLDVRDFCSVIGVDTERQAVEVEGMTTYEALVDATLAHQCMPTVVPQLKSITIGGAVSGIGIESSSFRYGLPHEGIQEMDILLGHGEVVTCTSDNEHRDLFHAMPNSYGTLGYILRLRATTLAVKPFVALQHIRMRDSAEFFDTMAAWCASDADFVDGVVFEDGEHYLTVGHLVDEAPYTSDYTYQNIYYRSIRERTEDFLTIYDYLWRWDTDWFWCSKNLFAQNPVARRLLGRKRLNSVFYTRVMRFNSRWKITRTFNRVVGNRPESVIQDVDIPIENAPAFLEFFHREIGIKPIWVCPIGHLNRESWYPFYPMDPEKLYVNFGFWDTVANRRKLEPGHFNRMIEEKVEELKGIKSLYSDCYFPEADFWRIYNGPTYRDLKQRYDPENRLKDLYEKCVLRG